ncbi:hypothetical protein C0J52_15780 [Blattella germanica]|nr:hypothetical protein C0J52_15780 [Blattella germanica]
MHECPGSQGAGKQLSLTPFRAQEWPMRLRQPAAEATFRTVAATQRTRRGKNSRPRDGSGEAAAPTSAMA